MIIPCIDLMDRKVVQLVQGREKALEGGTPDEMLATFADFPVIQLIDLDAAIGKGENDDIVAYIASKASTRVGGGVRNAARAVKLLEQGARKVIVGTAAFQTDGVNHTLLKEISAAAGAENVLIAVDSKDGRIVVKGWREATTLMAEAVVKELEPYCGGFLCTYVDKEGMLQGTNLDWFRSVRAATTHEITAAGGITTYDDVEQLLAMNVHAALGMAIYTGRLDLKQLARMNATAPLR